MAGVFSKSSEFCCGLTEVIGGGRVWEVRDEEGEESAGCAAVEAAVLLLLLEGCWCMILWRGEL